MQVAFVVFSTDFHENKNNQINGYTAIAQKTVVYQNVTAKKARVEKRLKWRSPHLKRPLCDSRRQIHSLNIISSGFSSFFFNSLVCLFIFKFVCFMYNHKSWNYILHPHIMKCARWLICKISHSFHFVNL